MLLFYVVMIVILASASTILRYRFLKNAARHKGQTIIYPEDTKKEPKQLRNKMDKIFLKLDILDNPELGIKQDIDHKKELQEDIDEYLNNMRPFISIVNNSLHMPEDKFAHIGYYFQGDMYDLDGKHLYESSRWVRDLENNFPWKKKGFLNALRNAASTMFKFNSK